MAFNTVVYAQSIETYRDSISYAIGVIWGQNMVQQGFLDLNIEQVNAALRSQLDGGDALMDAKTANNLVRDFLTQKKEVEKARNLEAGRQFLAENALRPEVKVTDSGLQYEILNEGDGPIPKASDKVRVHYHGTLIDGTVFDSSIERGEPIVFPVTGVIAGWVEALQMMKVGAVWKLYIPSSLAYGERGAGAAIGPNVSLIFKVELLGIE